MTDTEKFLKEYKERAIAQGLIIVKDKPLTVSPPYRK